MKIADFVQRFGEGARPIAHVVREWHVDECGALVRQLSQIAVGADLAGGAALIGNTLRDGAGFNRLDQIPQAVQDAFQQLMGVRVGDFLEMRNLLLQHVEQAGAGAISFTDSRVLGFINKLKGQIGENVFAAHVGSAAELATSGSQAGWDIAIRQADGAREYVQVKLYASPYQVVQHMRAVSEKIKDGAVVGANGECVRQIYFAVPEDIHAEVCRLAGNHDGLGEMVYEKAIPINSEQAADWVKEGMANVSQSQLNQFFNQLLGGAAVAGSLHAAVNAFLWYKGSKEFSDALASTVADTAVSTVGIAACLLAEQLCRAAIVSGAVGIGVRLFLGNLTRSRWAFGDFLVDSIEETRSRIFSLGPGLTLTSETFPGLRSRIRWTPH